jgi:transcriptional regulator of acetoin/glycerol metabolism
LKKEKLLIATALLQGGSKTELASNLGMSRATFYRKCEELRRALAALLDTALH